MQTFQKKKDRKNCLPVHVIATATSHLPLQRTSGKWVSHQHRPVWKEVLHCLHFWLIAEMYYITLIMLHYICTNALFPAHTVTMRLLIYRLPVKGRMTRFFYQFILVTEALRRHSLLSTGYIKEDDQPDVRIRRRRPYLAMFSPKAKSQKHQHWVHPLEVQIWFKNHTGTKWMNMQFCLLMCWIIAAYVIYMSHLWVIQCP